MAKGSVRKKGKKWYYITAPIATDRKEKTYQWQKVL